MATVTKKKLKETSPEDFDKKFGYVLAVENDERGLTYDGHTGREEKGKKYKSRVNVLFRSSIIWDGSDAVYEVPSDKNSKLISGHAAGRQIIRYYGGCTTLFEDAQPKDRETIAALVSSTEPVFLQDGYMFVAGHDVMLKKYLDICSWNEDSPYRVPSVNPVFKAIDVETSAIVLDESIDKLEEALGYAKKASDSKMMIHAQFLGVDLVDMKTSNPLPTKVIRSKYREAAMKNPKEFVRTYNDESIQIEGWINKALVEGVISTSIIPSKAVWKQGGSIICDISGLKASDSIMNKLIEYAKSDEGAGFKEMLEKLNK
jgi:hypothetical protein